MKRKLRLILTVMMVLTMMFGLTVTANAAVSSQTQQYLEEHAPGGNSGKADWVGSVSMYFSVTTDSTRTSTVTIGVNTGVPTVYYYNPADEASIESAVQTYLNTSNATNKVTDITDGLDIQADTETATNLLSGFTPIISTLLGIMVVLITLAMTVFSGFDICYIVFPVLRGKMEDSKNAGGAMAKKNADGGVSLRFVSDEAQFAVQQATTNPGKNAMTIYFGKRVVSYIVLAIVLFIIMTGNISLITNLALKVVDGILKVIQGIN